MSLRVSAAGLSLAAGGDRGRGREVDASLTFPSEVAVANPFPGGRVRRRSVKDPTPGRGKEARPRSAEELPGP